MQPERNQRQANSGRQAGAGRVGIARAANRHATPCNVSMNVNVRGRPASLIAPRTQAAHDASHRCP
jgi:hypothetical protein